MNVSAVSIKWVLVVGSVLVIPCLWFLPMWLLLLWSGCVWWRLQILRAKLNFPTNTIKVVLGILVLGLIFINFKTNLSLDAVATFVVSLFAIKLLEFKTKRDGLVLLFLAFIITAVIFLYVDNVLSVIYGFFVISLIFSAMVSLHGTNLTWFATWRLSNIFILWSIPFVTFLFVVIPRIDPLWSVPAINNKPRVTSGLSDAMSPADITEISKSNEKVFSVIFANDKPPAKSKLYWRALTYEEYHDKKWYQNRTSYGGKWYPLGDPIDYSVIMEPHNRYWLFSITAPFSDDKNVHATGDFRLYRTTPVNQVFRYNVSSYPDALLEPKLAQIRKWHNLKLPKNGNPKVREFAQQLAEQYTDAKSVVNAVFQHFRNNGFSYSLDLPVLGTDNIDDFFFNTKQGFCAHYAEAMTFMLRSAGIPARVVAGYQGGQWNDIGNFLQVRKSDAHAWVEYWSEGNGWEQIDPTIAVARERIFDIEQDLLSGEESAIDGSKFKQNNWLTLVSDNWDAINHKWRINILDYEQQDQISLIYKIFGDASLIKMLSILVGVFVGLFVLFFLWMTKPWHRVHSPLMRVILRFEKIIAKKYNLERENGETLGNFAQKVMVKVANNQQKQVIYQFANEIEHILYADKLANFTQLKKYIRTIKNNR